MIIQIDSERPPYEKYLIPSGFPRTMVCFNVLWEDEIVFKEGGTFVWKSGNETITYDVRLCDNDHSHHVDMCCSCLRRFWYGPDPIQEITITF